MRFLQISLSAAALAVLVLGAAGDAEAQRRGGGNSGGGRPGGGGSRPFNPSGSAPRIQQPGNNGPSIQRNYNNQPGNNGPMVRNTFPGFGGGVPSSPSSSVFRQSLSYAPSARSFQPQYTPTSNYYPAPQSASYAPSYTPLYQPAPYVPPVAYSQAPIRIMLPPDSPYEVNYLLNEWDYSMAPGEKQNFLEDRDWVIQFDRGRGLGHAMYSLEPGTYKFVRDEATGWQLYRVSSAVTSLDLGVAPATFGD